MIEGLRQVAGVLLLLGLGAAVPIVALSVGLAGFGWTHFPIAFVLLPALAGSLAGPLFRLPPIAVGFALLLPVAIYGGLALVSARGDGGLLRMNAIYWCGGALGLGLSAGLGSWLGARLWGRIRTRLGGGGR